MAFDTVRPIKAILQSDGEVILAEFTDVDSVPISNGGTSATTAAGARNNLHLIQYTEFTDLTDFDTLPIDKRLAKATDTGLLYYSHNNVWRQIGATQTTGISDGGVTANDVSIENFIFSGRVKFAHDSTTNTGTITVNVDDIEARLTTIEASDTTPDSMRYLIKERFDTLLGGVIPELDTLKEIADSLGDTLDFRNDFNTHVTSITNTTNTINTNLTNVTNQVTVIDGSDTTAGSFRKHVKDRFDELLDGVGSDRDTLKEIADALGSFVSTDFNTHVNNFNTHVNNFNTHVVNYNSLETDFNSLVGGSLSGISTNITTMASNITTLQSQIGVVDGDDQTIGSFRKAISDRFDILLDGVGVDFDTLKEIQDSLGGSGSISTDISNLTELVDEHDLLIFENDQQILQNRTLGVSNQININTVNANLQNFSYAGHAPGEISSVGTTFLIYDTNQDKFKFSTVTSTDDDAFDNFVPFIRNSGVRNDLPLTSVFVGNTQTSSVLNFTLTDGSTDNIELVVT